MTRKSKIRISFLWGAAFLLFAIVMVLVLQANSIATTVSTKDYPSVASAMAACNAERSAARSSGQDCDPCALACPSSAVKQADGTYTFSYSPTSTLYGGTFTGLNCDPSVKASGNLLEVKSFCHDTVRVCTRQSGTGTVKSTASTTNGKIQTITYKVETYDCTSGKTLGSSSTGVTGYQLVCDDGFFLSGRKTASAKKDLGKCAAVNDQPALSGSFGQVVVQEKVAAGKELTVRTAFKATAAGRYYFTAGIDETRSGQAFSIVTGSATQDLCGANRYLAGTFLDLEAGDTGIVSFSIPAPAETGSHLVTVTASGGCGKDTIDATTGTTKVVTEAQLKDEVIKTVITDNPDEATAARQDIADRVNEIMNLESCGPMVDLSVNGCSIANCVDGEVVLLDPDTIRDGCKDPDLADAVINARNGPAASAWSDLTDLGTTKGKILLVSGVLFIITLIGLVLFAPKKTKKGR